MRAVRVAILKACFPVLLVRSHQKGKQLMLDFSEDQAGHALDDSVAVGAISMQVRLQLLHRPDNMTAAHRAEQSAIFDGDAWEAEVLWQAARVLKEDFGRSEDDVRDALQAVTGRLSDLYEE